MTLASLPSISVQIAFNPSNITSTSQSWTDVTAYLLDFTTNSGKQHYLDRVEASTATLTFDNRTGYFLNGSTNGTGYVVQPRCPIKITATTGGTTYPIFWGLIDTVTEKPTDQLNNEIELQASDLTKYLSLKYLQSSTFWPTYANSGNALHWYRCSTNKVYTVTGATAGSSGVTYNAINSFTAGELVTITGMTSSGGSINLANNPVASSPAPTSSTFFISAPASGVTNIAGPGTAYDSSLTDLIGGVSGQYSGTVTFPTNGALVYDSDGCVDLANGGSSPSAYIAFPGMSGNFGGVDFWVLTQQTTVFATYYTYYGGSYYSMTLQTDPTGNLVSVVNVVGGLSPTTNNTNVKVTDGYWHHIGLTIGITGYIEIYVDGTFWPLNISPTYLNNNNGTSTVTYAIGYDSLLGANYAGYVDEIIFSGTGMSYTEVLNRYRAGSLLQQGFPTTANYVWSGDRIAEILCLAGFGGISGGQVYLNCSFSIGDSYGNLYGWSPGASTNGAVYVEPYYWNTPIYGSTALDLILQVCDTDIGMFIQQPDGSFVFYDQTYYGTWSWSGSSGSWSPSSSSWASAPLLSDNNTSTYHYPPETLQIIRDDADLWTSVKITPQAGIDQIYENTANEPRWGFSTLTKSSTVHTSLNSALSTAYFLGYLFRTPLPRVQAVELRSETNNGANLPVMLNAKPAEVVFFTRNSVNYSTSGSYPGQEGAIVNQPMVVEAVSHDFVANPGYWHTTFTLDPYPVRS